MKVGVFDHLDRGTVPLSEFYEQRLRVTEAYDRAGFYSYHIAEHHATPLGMAPSPSVFLAAVAQRTQRLRFGPLVYLLPLYHPLRLSEEIAMLDHLSAGRLDVGIGRGISPIETTLYGGDYEHGQEIFDEVLAVLKLAWSSDQLDYHGTHFDFSNVPIQLKPVQRPHPPFWYGVSSPESAASCVEHGYNAITLSATDRAAAIARSYNETAAKSKRSDLLFGLARFVVVGKTDEEALGIARRAYPMWAERFHHLYHAHGRSPMQGERPKVFEGMAELGIGIAGSAQTVTQALQSQLAQTRANYLVGQFVFGDMTLDESLASIDRFTREVLPALQLGGVAAASK